MEAERRVLVKAYPPDRIWDAFTLSEILSEAGLDAWVNELTEEEAGDTENTVHLTVSEVQAEQAGDALRAIMEGADDAVAARVHAELYGETRSNLYTLGTVLAWSGPVMLVLMLVLTADVRFSCTLGGMLLLPGLVIRRTRSKPRFPLDIE
ncbi:MAG: hypothetical protein AAGI08_02315 [Bacteroidota bacterium]